MVVRVAVEDAAVELSVVGYSRADSLLELFAGGVSGVDVSSEVLVEEPHAEVVDGFADGEAALLVIDRLLRPFLDNQADL